jgi:hypothetical protein
MDIRLHLSSGRLPGTAATGTLTVTTCTSASGTPVITLGGNSAYNVFGSSQTITVAVTGVTNGATYQWTTTCPGTFANSTAASTTFTFAGTLGATTGNTGTFTVVVKGTCGGTGVTSTTGTITFSGKSTFSNTGADQKFRGF